MDVSDILETWTIGMLGWKQVPCPCIRMQAILHTATASVKIQVVIIPRKLSVECGGAADTAEQVLGWAANKRGSDMRTHPLSTLYAALQQTNIETCLQPRGRVCTFCNSVPDIKRSCLATKCDGRILSHREVSACMQPVLVHPEPPDIRAPCRI